jgi:hypothetical protein
MNNDTSPRTELYYGVTDTSVGTHGPAFRSASGWKLIPGGGGGTGAAGVNDSPSLSYCGVACLSNNKRAFVHAPIVIAGDWLPMPNGILGNAGEPRQMQEPGCYFNVTQGSRTGDSSEAACRTMD